MKSRKVDFEFASDLLWILIKLFRNIPCLPGGIMSVWKKIVQTGVVYHTGAHNIYYKRIIPQSAITYNPKISVSRTTSPAMGLYRRYLCNMPQMHKMATRLNMRLQTCKSPRTGWRLTDWIPWEDCFDVSADYVSGYSWSAPPLIFDFCPQWIRLPSASRPVACRVVYCLCAGCYRATVKRRITSPGRGWCLWVTGLRWSVDGYRAVASA